MANYETDPEREGDTFHNLTGIYLRAKGTNGKRGSYDIAELRECDVRHWLKTEGGDNPLAENIVVNHMLGHEISYSGEVL